MGRKITLETIFHWIGVAILGWLFAAFVVSFLRGMPHSMRDDNHCAPQWGIQHFVPGDLFCNDDEIYEGKND